MVCLCQKMIMGEQMVATTEWPWARLNYGGTYWALYLWGLLREANIFLPLSQLPAPAKAPSCQQMNHGYCRGDWRNAV